MPIVFCNVSWMQKYAGRDPDDPPLGGGGFPRVQGYCGEECNFVPGDDGFVYGHFETIKGKIDRQVLIERLGAEKSANFVDGVDVVWTAPELGNDPRVVVGWYRNARVHRRRMNFDGSPPSDRHRDDEILSYVVRARAEDAFLLPVDQRDLRLSRGSGWSGQTSWWYAEYSADASALAFVSSVRTLIEGGTVTSIAASSDRRAGAASSVVHVRYFNSYETTVHPLHDQLQKRFVAYLRAQHPSVTFPASHRDDLRYTIPGRQEVMVEVKPSDKATVRFAIRLALGQLLDYRQHQRWQGPQLIVVGSEVSRADDLSLALDNGFGIAWPVGEAHFEVRWPG